jgi:signal peptidase I
LESLGQLAPVLAVWCCLGCGHSEIVAPPPITLPPIHEVVVYTWPTYVQVGDTLRVQAGGFNVNGWEITEPIRTVVWQTSDSDRIKIEPALPIIPIQPSIYALGLAPGVAHVSATLNGVTGSDSVIVLPALREIDVVPRTATVHVGDSLPITARIVATDGTVISGPYIVWASSDPNVANFGPGNTVIGLQVGVARISATLAQEQGDLDLTVVP